MEILNDFKCGLTVVYCSSFSSNSHCVIVIIIVDVDVGGIQRRDGRLQSGRRHQALLPRTATVYIHRSTRQHPRRHLLL